MEDEPGYGLRRVAVSLTLAVLAGCASAPPSWLDAGESIPIRWVESAVPSASVRDEVCELRFADRSDGELPHVEALVRQCLVTGGLRWAGQPGAMHVRWHRVQTHQDLVERFRDAHGSDTIQAGGGRFGGRRVAGGFFSAFYYRTGDTCHIVTLRQQSFGHEMKHCRDGDYHL